MIGTSIPSSEWLSILNEVLEAFSDGSRDFEIDFFDMDGLDFPCDFS